MSRARIMGHVALLCLALIMVSGVHSVEQYDLKARLAVAPSEAACLEFAQRFDEFGEPQFRIFELTTPILVTWIEPFPDRKPVSFVFGYFLQDDNWYLFLDEIVEARFVSVRISEGKDRLIVESNDSRELISRSIQNPTPLREESSE